MIKGHKQDSMLIFSKTEENYKVKYDLTDGSVYKNRGKSTHWRQVKSIKDFFRNQSANNIIEGFDSEAYQTFMMKIADAEYRCTNVGTFLERLKKYAHLEHYSISGINFDYEIKREIHDYPKDVLKFFSDFGVFVDVELEDEFFQNPEIYTTVIRYLHANYIPEDYRVQNFIDEMFTSSFRRFFDLVGEEYNCEPKALVKYIIWLVNNEAFELSDALTTLRDYQSMQKRVCRSNKYEKYPRWLASVHDIVQRNYSALNVNISQSEWDKIVPKDFEYVYGKYAVVAPKTVQSLLDEGSQLHHCVGSYAKDIVAGKTTILFLRKRTDENPDEKKRKSLLDESLVTMEVQNGVLIQALGKQNRLVTPEERKFLKLFAKNKDLQFQVPEKILSRRR